MAKMNDIRFLAKETAKEVSGSPWDWMRYLDTASRLYRYPFSDTLLIHVDSAGVIFPADAGTAIQSIRKLSGSV